MFIFLITQPLFGTRYPHWWKPPYHMSTTHWCPVCEAENGRNCSVMPKSYTCSRSWAWTTRGMPRLCRLHGRLYSESWTFFQWGWIGYWKKTLRATWSNDSLKTSRIWGWNGWDVGILLVGKQLLANTPGTLRDHEKLSWWSPSTWVCSKNQPETKQTWAESPCCDHGISNDLWHRPRPSATTSSTSSGRFMRLDEIFAGKRAIQHTPRSMGFHGKWQPNLWITFINDGWLVLKRGLMKLHGDWVFSWDGMPGYFFVVLRVKPILGWAKLFSHGRWPPEKNGRVGSESPDFPPALLWLSISMSFRIKLHPWKCAYTHR